MDLPAAKKAEATYNEYGALRTMEFSKEACDRIKAMSDADFIKTKRDFPHLEFMLDYIRDERKCGNRKK